ncbi:MAG: NAD(P)-dependent oxidoreductase [Cytophagia bacterium]|nr:MAG: NAD(P)-dependent oxidoreductase [Runella sp.]TAG21601.1 MAG: NAD(P)-dependent oxidoreductase [Cytophagales bacterium]TAG40864.1 MAG: NAD(P)-dependent oxidoreductase [Cytophagia bacterium]TAG52930.1 MAG: NAD(P)-dependent oxidoreductase [Runella slithyformis]TAG82403.1 MAG: NAD(P)-dependent oxidoreductase [Cytophagales bacterium]
MKKILVTGSNGLLGQKLMELLVQQPDIKPIATARGVNRLPFTDGYEYHAMDITDPAQVAEVIEKTRPDAIIHGAAMTNVDQCEFEKENCWAQNVKAVEYLITACQKHDIFLCHVSTDFIFDGASGPYTEEAQANPLSFYGWSKYAAEKLVQHSGVRWAIARTVLVYGIAYDMSRSNIILWVKKSLEDGKNIKVVTDQWRTPTLAEDLAMGCYLIGNQQPTGIFNISGKDFLTPYEMAIKTADYFKLDKSLIAQADSTTFSQPAQRPARTGFVLDKAQNILGYRPRSFDEGIAILAEQMGQH